MSWNYRILEQFTWHFHESYLMHSNKFITLKSVNFPIYIMNKDKDIGINIFLFYNFTFHCNRAMSFSSLRFNSFGKHCIKYAIIQNFVINASSTLGFKSAKNLSIFHQTIILNFVIKPSTQCNVYSNNETTFKKVIP